MANWLPLKELPQAYTANDLYLLAQQKTEEAGNGTRYTELDNEELLKEFFLYTRAWVDVESPQLPVFLFLLPIDTPDELQVRFIHDSRPGMPFDIFDIDASGFNEDIQANHSMLTCLNSPREFDALLTKYFMPSATHSPTHDAK